MKTFRDFLLNEEIFGNTAVVYHRGEKNKLNHLLKQTYSNRSHIDFNNYNKALYTTTSMAAQLNQTGNKNNMHGTYGDYIIKLAFKGVSNCWFCSYNEYKKYNDCAIDNWKEQQFKKFNIDKEHWKELSGNDKKFTANHTVISKFFEKYNLLGTRIKGIQYDGEYDGDCLLIYDWTTAVPLAVTNNEGKTWKKVDKSKTTFQRGNFKNNDYIDTNKKIKFNFKTDDNGNVNCFSKELTTLEGAPKQIDGDFNCSKNKLITLKGAPKEIGGHFYCSNNNLTTLEGAPKEVGKHFDCSKNKLTTLEGAPQKVGESFYCTYNELTTLKGAPKKIGGWFYCQYNNLTTLDGAPQEVGGSFVCSENKNLSKEEIVKYLKTAKIGGKIITDYGYFKQQEALEKLSILKENYFNY